MADQKRKIRTYRYYSAAKLDSAYIRISNKIRFKKDTDGTPLSEKDIEQKKKLLDDIDYERSFRF